MATPAVQVVATFKDNVSAAVQKMDKAVGQVFNRFDAATTAVQRVNTQIAAFLPRTTSLSKQFPNLARAAGVFSTALTTAARAGGTFARSMAAVAGSVTTLGSSLRTAVSALLSFRTLFVGAVVGVVGNALIGSIRQTAEALDDLGAVSRRTGIPVQTLSRLQVAAKLANVEFTTLARSLGILNRTIGGLDGNQRAQDAFSALGITRQQVREARNLSDLLPLIANGLNRLGEAQRANVAAQLFGRGAFEILTLFEGGAGKLQKALAEVDEFNLAVTANQVNAADELTDSIDRVAFAYQKVKASLIEAFGPTASALLDRFAKFLSNLPNRVQGLLQSINAALGSQGPEGEIARGLLSLLATALPELVFNAFVAGAKAAGLTVIEVLRVGIIALTPVVAAVFRDAIGPTLNKILPESLQISPTVRGEIRDIEDRLGDVIKTEQATRATLAKTTEELQIRLGVLRAQQNELSRLEALQDREGNFPTLAIFQQAQAAQREINRLQTEQVKPLQDLKASLEDRIRQTNRYKVLQAELAQESQAFVTELTNAFNSIGIDGGKALADFKAANQENIDLIEDALLILTEYTPTVNETTREVEKQESFWSKLRRTIGTVSQTVTEFFGRTQQGQRQLDDFNAQLQVRALRAQGRAEEADLLELRRAQSQETEKLIQQNGRLSFGLVQAVAALQRVQQAEFDALVTRQSLSAVTEDLSQIERAYQDRLSQIDSLVQTGALTKTAAQVQIRTAAQETTAAVETLLVKLREVQGAAGGNFAADFEKLIADAERFQRTVRQPNQNDGTVFGGIRAGVQDLTDQLGNAFDIARRITVDVAGSIASSFSNAFRSVIDGSKSVIGAFQDFATSIILNIIDIIAQLLAMQAILAVLNVLFPGSTQAGGFAAALVGRNQGGIIPGSGPDRDSVLLHGTPGEFVQRRKAVQFYGVGAMQAINDMLIPPDVLARYSSGRAPRVGTRLNTGGVVGASNGEGGGGAAAAVLVVNDRTATDILQGMKGPLLRFLSENRNKF